MAHVELSVLSSCVDLVYADELPVSGIPLQQRTGASKETHGKNNFLLALLVYHITYEMLSQSFLLVKEAAWS